MTYDNAVALNRLFSRCRIVGSCFEFSGPLNRPKNGYPKIGIGGKNRLGHRVVFESHFGEIPKNFCVMHKCDNTRCLNPAHMQLGTKKDNTHDMIAKGRAVIPVPIKKRTGYLISRIRELRSQGMTQKEIAELLGVCKQTVRRGIKDSKQ